ncbi:MAG: hypothetical protein EXQ53_09020, partial [Acidobacteria bacterium]|nr:hypothetical protein [Acidobacteriota bacterium]
MDEPIMASHRASAVRPDPPADEASRFRNLVHSPLRAGLLRFLNARPEEAFDVDSLMSAFGRMRLDVDNCLNDLVEFGVVRGLPGPPSSYIAERPVQEAVARLLDTFLERRTA